MNKTLNPNGCKVFCIGSGKGGVGKSTVAVNLAISLAHQGHQVGLLDADVYGPSIPIMLGLRRLTPKTLSNANGEEKILPFTKFGIKAISIGFFIEEARSVIWRGPILHGTLEKILHHVYWGEIEILIVDLPPGTGDVPLSLSQLLSINGALVVTTPQEVAMLDAIKAINAFYHLDIPLLGIIENMAGFIAPDTGQMYPIFGQGKAKELANRFNTSLLGSIPLIQSIRQGCDEGYPCSFYQESQAGGSHFHLLAKAFTENYLMPAVNPFL